MVAPHGLNVLDSTCFVAGTPLLTPTGHKTIEQFSVGDQILSRPEDTPDAANSVQTVEEVFELSASIVKVTVNGRTIDTTHSHPFYVVDKGWVKALELTTGDTLVGHDGQTSSIENVVVTDEMTTVYNLRVSEDHTYFVGAEHWGFSVWVHNANYKVVPVLENGVHKLDDAGNKLYKVVDDSIGDVRVSQNVPEQDAIQFADELNNADDFPEGFFRDFSGSLAWVPC